MRVLVTGATGFVGRTLVQDLARRGYHVVAGVRATRTAPHTSAHGIVAGAAGTVAMPELSAPFDAGSIVNGVDGVVHLAGLAHSSAEIPEAIYQATNCAAARTLAQAAREAGVRRFIYVSSVRAQSGPSAKAILTEDDVPAPSDAYGHSKLAGERAVADVLRGSQCEAVILRPVLMYGPNPKGNMATLERLARSPAPLPLGSLPARRSLLGLANFNDAVAFALNAPQAAGGTFLLADAGPPLTVGEMVAALRAGLGRRPGIVPLPLPGVSTLLARAGKADTAARLFEDLVVSTAKMAAAGWRAPLTSAQGLAAVILRSRGD